MDQRIDILAKRQISIGVHVIEEVRLRHFSDTAGEDRPVRNADEIPVLGSLSRTGGPLLERGRRAGCRRCA